MTQDERTDQLNAELAAIEEWRNRAARQLLQVGDQMEEEALARYDASGEPQ